MPYLIDGHNLIPKIRGLSLKAIDDENELIRLLQVFCRIKQKKMDVYFDGAPAGFSGTRRYGSVTAHFIRKGIAADEAIIARVQELGKRAKNWIVITSDRRIQAKVRSAQAQIIASEVFAQELQDVYGQAFDTSSGESDKNISADEVEIWLKLFKDGEENRRKKG